MSSINTKGNKPTLKDKAAASERPLAAMFDGTDNLAIDPVLAKEIEDAGLAHRWINANVLKKNYGFDPRRWSPYKRKTQVPNGMDSFGYTDSEGFVRRGDLVLAVQSREIANARKAVVDRKNKTLAASQQKVAAEQLRRSFKDAGISEGVSVHEGYDEND